MQVIVLTSVRGNDLDILMLLKVGGGFKNTEVIPLVGQAYLRGGNPYALYGKLIKQYFKINPFDTKITVFNNQSGSLEGLYE